MKYNILLIITLIIAKTATGQCLLVPVSLEKRINASTLVVEGKVISQRSFWDAGHQHIYTANTIEVYKSFKGTSSSEIEITTQGGTVGDEAETVIPGLVLSIGDIGIYTCIPAKVPAYNSSLQSFEPFASVQGFIKYNENEAIGVFDSYTVGDNLYSKIESLTNSEMQVLKAIEKPARLAAVATITGFSPTSINGGVHAILTITGSGFGAAQGNSTVGFKNCDNGGKNYISPLASQYISWSDNEIRVEVPAGAGTGTIQVTNGSPATSLNSLSVPYSQLNVTNSFKKAFQADHINQSGNGGYLWHMYADFDAKSDAKAAFLRAFVNWRCATDVNWAIGTVTSNNATKSDGQNVIRFDNGAELATGVLGACYSYYKGCSSENVWYVSELDIEFDDNAPWNFSTAPPLTTQYDFESVVVHELGHGHQLAHVIDQSDLMNYALFNGTSHRDINANDLACAQNVMQQSIVENACGPTEMVKIDASSCNDPGITYPVKGYSVYPSLFDKTIHVNYTLENKAKVLVALYNSAGIQVALFRNETQETGGYDYDFDVSSLDLQHGIYLLQVSIGDKSNSTKMFKQL